VSCNRPLRGYHDPVSKAVKFGDAGEGTGRPVDLPCGRCMACRLERARMWSVRINHEASLYDSNLFVTLTYAREKLTSWGLRYRDFQLFMKKLRKELEGVSEVGGRRPIRFFVAGEYGAERKRPHWHAILFNVLFPDQVRLAYTRESASETLDRLWNHGRTHIGTVTPESAAYVAGYTLKKKFGRGTDAYYDVVDRATGELVEARRREFVQMSRDPGIGAWWYDRFASDLYPLDRAVQAGRAYKAPRYYWEKFKASADPLEVEAIEHKRFLKAQELPIEERSERRRAAREDYLAERSKFWSPRDLA